MKLLRTLRSVAVVLAGSYALLQPSEASASPATTTLACGVKYCSDSCWTLFWKCADTCPAGNGPCMGSCTGASGHTYTHGMSCNQENDT
jgi:hypothetical protein